MDKTAGEVDHARRMDELAAREGYLAKRTAVVEGREQAVEVAEMWQRCGRVLKLTEETWWEQALVVLRNPTSSELTLHL